MIPITAPPAARSVRSWLLQYFDLSTGRDMAPSCIVERLQPAGWVPVGYLVVSIVLAVAIYGFSELSIGPLHYTLTVLVLGLALTSFLYPALGMMLVISVVLLMPPGTRVPGLGPISPNLLLTAATALGFGLRLVRRWFAGERRLLAWSDLYLPLIPLLGIHAASAVLGHGPRAPFLLLTFAQGTYPFAIARTAQRSRETLLLSLAALTTAYTGRSLYLLIFEGFPSCWNPYPHYSGGLGPLRYGHTLYGDPATVLAWIANLMVALTLGLFVFARGWPARAFFFFTFIISMLIAWMSLARGGMMGSMIVLAAIGVMAWRAHQRRAMVVGAGAALCVVLFVSSCLPLVPHLADSMGIDLGRRDESRGAVWVEGISRFTGPNPLFTEEDIASSEDWGGVPNLLVGDGPGTRRGYHSYVINSAVDYGLPFLCLIVFMLWLVLRNGARLVKASAQADPLIRGAAIGLFAGAIVAVVQALFDTTLRVAGYAMLFWYLRGIEASLLSSLTPDD